MAGKHSHEPYPGVPPTPAYERVSISRKFHLRSPAAYSLRVAAQFPQQLSPRGASVSPSCSCHRAARTTTNSLHALLSEKDNAILTQPASRLMDARAEVLCNVVRSTSSIALSIPRPAVSSCSCRIAADTVHTPQKGTPIPFATGRRF